MKNISFHPHKWKLICCNSLRGQCCPLSTQFVMKNISSHPHKLKLICCSTLQGQSYPLGIQFVKNRFVHPHKWNLLYYSTLQGQCCPRGKLFVQKNTVHLHSSNLSSNYYKGILSINFLDTQLGFYHLHGILLHRNFTKYLGLCCLILSRRGFVIKLTLKAIYGANTIEKEFKRIKRSDDFRCITCSKKEEKGENVSWVLFHFVGPLSTWRYNKQMQLYPSSFIFKSYPLSCFTCS